MNPLVGFRQYLFTDSEVDKSKFSTRESFREILGVELNATISTVKVDYWDCSRNESQNDSFHCQCALMMVNCKSWLQVKNSHEVNFRDKHNFYTNIISICLHTSMFVKGTKRHLTVKTIHEGFS